MSKRTAGRVWKVLLHLIFMPWVCLSFFLDAEVSPPILTTPLNPINQDRCKFWYRDNKEAFRKGINRMLMCAGDEQLKSCPSDTGGPLQVKLLSSSRYTPFVVGVSALGVPCGATTPGVYAKVPHYILWIEAVTKLVYHPPECVIRHISRRELDTSLVAPELKVRQSDWSWSKVLE